MKILFPIDKAAALRAGKDIYGDRVVEVPAGELSAELRETLLKHGRTSNECVDFSLSAVGNYGDFGKYGDLRKALRAKNAEPTKTQAILFISGLWAIDQEEIRDEKEKREQRRKELLAKPAEGFLYQTTEYKPIKHNLWRLSGDPTVEFPELKKVIEEASALAEALTLHSLNAALEEKEKEDRRLKALADKKADDRSKLIRWAVENGSSLLKKRMEGGFQWISLAQEEWSEKTFAFLGEQASKSWSKEELRNHPTEPEMDAQNWLQEKLEVEPTTLLDPTNPPECEVDIVWCTPRLDDEETGEYTDERFALIKIDFKMPCCDVTQSRYYEPEQILEKMLTQSTR